MSTKYIEVKSCLECPISDKCKVWGKVTSDQRVYLACGVGVVCGILKGCPLPDLEVTE